MSQPPSTQHIQTIHADGIATWDACRARSIPTRLGGPGMGQWAHPQAIPHCHTETSPPEKLPWALSPAVKATSPTCVWCHILCSQSGDVAEQTAKQYQPNYYYY